MFTPIYDRPWKKHEKRKWLEYVLKNLHKKLITTIEEINKTDGNASKKLKTGKDRKKRKFCSFPVGGRKKSRIKYPLVNAIHVEPNSQKETETAVNVPKRKLPEAEKFWKYVDVCYELTCKASNVRESKEAAQKSKEVAQKSKEVVQKEEAKKCLKLPRKRRKRVKKQRPAEHRCFARTRPGFLTSVITDTNFFYPIIVGKRIRNLALLEGVRRCRADISKPDTQKNNVEKAKLKQKPKPKPQRRSAHICNANAKKTCVENVKPKNPQCKASKPKTKKRKRKNCVSKAKSESRDVIMF